MSDRASSEPVKKAIPNAMWSGFSMQLIYVDGSRETGEMSAPPGARKVDMRMWMGKCDEDRFAPAEEGKSRDDAALGLN